VEPAAAIGGVSALSGGVTRRLMQFGFQANALQPYIGNDGNTYITVMEAGKPVAREITANALLRRDEWRDLDRTVVLAATERLRLVALLRARGLVRNLGGLGTLMAEYERGGDMGPANVDMSGVTRSDEDTIGFDLDGVPVPIIHKGFRINIRRLEASRRLGQGLDVVQGEIAGRKVAEKLEDLFFNGSSIQVQGRSIPGLTTHAARNTLSISNWTNAGTRTPIADVLAMIAAASTAGFDGPFVLFLPRNFWTPMLEDYKAESDRTLLDRLRGIEGIDDVLPSDRLAANNTLLVQMTADVIQLGEALGITPVDWEEVGGMEQHFKVMTAAVPILRSTQTSKTGIVHGVAV
jgi:uncharacterized linocin/CFP29 family protein